MQAIEKTIIDRGRKLFTGPVTFTKGVVALDGLPASDRAEVCFAGRSNVGKSSLINALTNRNKLARSSSEPGRTRELNYFDVGEGQLWVVDLPGFGYAKVSRTQSAAWTKLIKSYMQGRPNLRRIFLLVDSRRGLMPHDFEIMAMLNIAAVTFQIILTKADKVKPTGVAYISDTIKAAIKKHPAAHPEVLITSAEKGDGIPELRAEIVQLIDF